MAVSDGWTERTRARPGRDPVRVRARRSLKAALFEAGLGEPPPAARAATPRKTAAGLAHLIESQEADLHEARSPHVALFDEPAPPSRTEQPHSVVSPPPWLRAARRGRRQARLLNALGWMMTLAVAGTIIGLAGHFLGLSAPGFEGILSARQ